MKINTICKIIFAVTLFILIIDFTFIIVSLGILPISISNTIMSILDTSKVVIDIKELLKATLYPFIFLIVLIIFRKTKYCISKDS